MNRPKLSWWQRLGQLFDRFLARWPTMEKPTINWALLHRYAEGTATEAERRAFDQWVGDADAEDIRTFFDPQSDPDVEAIKAEVWARLERGEAPAFPSYQHYAPSEPVRDLRVVLWSRANRLKAAAVVALILGGALAVWQTGRAIGEPHTATAFGTINAPVGLPPLSASLPDGSQVVLSPGSTLRYAKTFGVGRREVHLEGEAYFAVRHDTSRPFSVRTGQMMVEDLGTEFVVRAYPEDRSERVAVREGQVRMNGTLLIAGELGRLEPKGTVAVEPADIAPWFAWTQGQLRFERMPLRDALPQLSRWYDVQFRLADLSFGDRELSGLMPPRLDDRFLKTLEVALGLHVTRQGRVVTIR